MKTNTKNLASFIDYKPRLTPVGVLRAARKILAQPGVWIKCNHISWGEDGKLPVQCCATGALHTAAGMEWRLKERVDQNMAYVVEHEAEQLLRSSISPPKAAGANRTQQANAIIDFNDNSKTTLEQVLGAFDRAITKASRK